ncbi:hypothetical protein [Gordonia amicalis]|uniref:Uncharacterized protein n=1 Tax=Gordonia amicalis TaxID=89053 RepID=A0ABU4DKX4_9ACTN|nr:hypothetical protein [Gordonia amicalis]MDV6309934.1 hypothetical protein [Gordonia amicalis]
MSAAFQWEEVEVPRGAYISWGEQVGQSVTGKVLDYDETGGKDFYDKVCPSLAIELIEPAFSVNKQREVTNHGAGEIVQMNVGLVSLKRAVRAAALNPGDIVKIELTNIVPLQGGKKVKEFGIKVARGAGGSAKPTSAPVADAPAPAPAAASDVPAGFTAEQWAGMPEPTKAAILAAQ